MNFNEDLKDGIAIASIIKNYVGSIKKVKKTLKKMNKKCEAMM